MLLSHNVNMGMLYIWSLEFSAINCVFVCVIFLFLLLFLIVLARSNLTPFNVNGVFVIVFHKLVFICFAHFSICNDSILGAVYFSPSNVDGVLVVAPQVSLGQLYF